LTFRFQLRVVDKCRKIGRHWNFDRETCDLLAERVFERFYHNPFKFQCAECLKRHLTIEECTKLYLFKIAQRCFIDHNNEIFQAINSPYDGSEHVIIDFPSLDYILNEEKRNDLHEKQKVIAAALASVTPKHKIIYLTYKSYEHKGFKLPRPLLKELREVTGLNQNSIRVYKNETFNIIEEYKTEHGAK